MDQIDHFSRRTLRLPQDAVRFIEEQASRNFTSQNAEIVRAVRERMERVKAVAENSLQAGSATVPNRTALQGGPIAHG